MSGIVKRVGGALTLLALAVGVLMFGLGLAPAFTGDEPATPHDATPTALTRPAGVTAANAVVNGMDWQPMATISRRGP